MKKRLLLNTILYTVLPKLPTVAGIFVLPLITPYLTLEDYGNFGLVIAYYSVFSLFVTLGQDIVLQNSFFEYKKHFPKVWSRCFGIMIVGSIFMSAILSVILYFTLGRQFNSEFYIVSSMFSIALICTPLTSIAQIYFVMKEKPFPLALRSLIMGVLNAAVVYITIRFFSLGYLGWVIGFAVNGLTSLLFFHTICVKNQIFPNFNYKKKHIKEYLKIGLPLLPHNLATYVLNTSSRLLLDLFKVNVKSIGIYSQGTGLGSNGMIFITGLFTALSRTLQEILRSNTKESQQKLVKIFNTVMLSTGIVFFNCSVWMKEIYLFLFRTPELQTGYPIAVIAIMGYTFFVLYDFVMYPLFINKKSQLISRISILAGLFSLISNLILIPFYNYWGALITTYLSFIIFGMGGILHKRIRAELNNYYPKVVKIYVAYMTYGIFLTLLAWLLMDISVILKFITSLTSVITLTLILLKSGMVSLPVLLSKKL